MINHYVFETALKLSGVLLVLTVYFSLNLIISGVHVFALIYRTSLLLAVRSLWYLLVNFDIIFKDSLIDLLVHSAVLKSNLLTLWRMKSWSKFHYVSDRVCIFCYNFDFEKP